MINCSKYIQYILYIVSYIFSHILDIECRWQNRFETPRKQLIFRCWAAIELKFENFSPNFCFSNESSIPWLCSNHHKYDSKCQLFLKLRSTFRCFLFPIFSRIENGDEFLQKIRWKSKLSTKIQSIQKSQAIYFYFRDFHFDFWLIPPNFWRNLNFCPNF